MNGVTKNDSVEGLTEKEILDRIIRYAKGAYYKPSDSELSDRLLNTFGSLYNVLTTDAETLMYVEGVNDSTAVLISLFKNVKERMNEDKNAKCTSFKDTDSAKEYVARMLELKRNECFVAIAINEKGKIIKSKIITEGSITHAQVDMRKMITFLLGVKASGVIVGHNHPDGSSKPSYQDILFTKRLNSTLNALNIELYDHIIIGKYSAFSIMTEGENLLLNK